MSTSKLGNRSRVHAHVVLSDVTWKAVRKLAVDVDKDASDLVELALRLLLALRARKDAARKVLSALVDVVDSETLEQLKRVADC